MQQILSYMRKAINDYDMIQDGDKIAVALSGGKDSTAMLMGFKNLQIFFPKKFDIIAVSIDPGFEHFDRSILERTCEKVGVKLIIEESHAKEIVFDIRKEKNPCSLCANIRRGILNSVVNREGCNKIAIGHNQDDVIETLLLNLFYAGNFNTFAPVSYMDRSKVTLIRPLVYAPEKEIRKFVKRNNVEIMPKTCPMDGYSNREKIKNLIHEMSLTNPMLKANLFGSIKRKEINGWHE